MREMQTIVKLNVRTEHDGGHVTWVDIDTSDAEGRSWLQTQSSLSEHAKSLLLEPKEVIRRENLEHGLFVSFCGFNPTGKAENGDLFWVGLLIEQDRVITARSGIDMAIEEIHKEVQRGKGPETPLDFLAFLVLSMRNQLENTITDLSGETDALEDRMIVEDADDPSVNDVIALLRKVFHIRRYFVQFQNVLKLIVVDPVIHFSKTENLTLTGATELLGGYLDIIEDCRGRVQLMYDQIQAQLSQKTAGISYKLTVVATVFLPLSFITGLLGMNTLGIPETHNPYGFWIVCGFLMVLGIGGWALLRWKRWL
jgi:zinc transporter